MANQIKLKRNVVADAAPTVGQIEVGEILLNNFSGRMFIEKTDGGDAIVEFIHDQGGQTINGALTVGAFTSTGIDDNATSERLQISDDLLTIGPTTIGSGYAIIRPIDTGSIQIRGGQVGASIDLYGSSHSTLANDIEFTAGSNIWGTWDESFGTLTLFTGTGSKSLTATFSANGLDLVGGYSMAERADHAFSPFAAFGEIWLRNDTNQTLVFTDDQGTDYEIGGADVPSSIDWKAGTEAGFNSLGIDDNATGERFQLTDILLNLGASGGGYGIGHIDTDQFIEFSGGNTVNLGANIRLFGSTHGSNAGDLIFRTSANVWMNMDESGGNFGISTGSGSKTIALTINSLQKLTCSAAVAFGASFDYNHQATTQDQFTITALAGLTSGSLLKIDSPGASKTAIVVEILQTHGSSTADALSIIQSATAADAINITHNATSVNAAAIHARIINGGLGIHIQDESTTHAGGILHRVTSNNTARTTDLAALDQGHASSTARVMLLTSAGTGGMLYIAGTGANLGDTVYIEHNNASKQGNVFKVNQAHTSSTATALAVRNDGTTGNAIRIDVFTSGAGLFINHGGDNGEGIVVQMAASGGTGVGIDILDAGVGLGTLLQINANNSSRTLPLTTITQDHASSSADVLKIQQDGTGLAFDIISGKAQFVGINENAEQYTATTGTRDLDVKLGTYFYPSADLGTAVITFTFSNLAASGKVSSWMLELLGADGATLTWPAAVDWGDAGEPTWTAGIDVVAFWTHTGTSVIHGAAAILNSS